MATGQRFLLSINGDQPRENHPLPISWAPGRRTDIALTSLTAFAIYRRSTSGIWNVYYYGDLELSVYFRRLDKRKYLDVVS
ncbi:hypothetical protein EYF80_063176 [Liparis tanakae]|uniref:Uncharacterized protein n=1 Tax=Liparis tanakae TaxID=230148 RepID=A0A4Z2ED44_9TELE|nr:hypothetical protein EYF80_063176 [Liparis tanakae]